MRSASTNHLFNQLSIPKREESKNSGDNSNF